MVVKRWIEASDIWKDRARYVQLQLRGRLRVAVDSHRSRRPILSGDSYSRIQLWLDRFRDFRRDSLPSSTTFYRKRVTSEMGLEEDSLLTRMLQAVAVPVLGNVCHVFMHGLNRVQIYGAEKLQHACLDRPKNKPLITVSNHVASMDDPLIIASLLPPSVLLHAPSLRWTLCASDRCFQNPVTSAFFKHVKVLPLTRGEGVYQKGMDLAITKLNKGEWVHIFPEGRRSLDGGKTMALSKRGIGRLVVDAENVPLVIPFVHTGMQDIMPLGAKIPRIGKTVTVLIGDPIEFEDIMKEKVETGELYDSIAARVGERLQKLKTQVEKLAKEQSIPYNYSAERAASILHQLDWESMGMDNYIQIENNMALSPKQELLPVEEVVKEEKHCEKPRDVIRFDNEGGVVSRMRGYMGSSELMGFAARGLFMNNRVEGSFGSDDRVPIEPFKAWNKFWKSMYDDCNNPTYFNQTVVPAV